MGMQMIIRSMFVLAGLATALTIIGPAGAHEDVLVSQDQAANGTLIIGTYDDGLPGVADPGPVRVFGYDTEFDGSAPYFGNGEPGFRARPNVEVNPFFQLPVGGGLGFNFKAFTIGIDSANLWYWDGMGSVDFDPATTHQLKWKKGASEASVTGANADVTGFNIANVSGTNTIHQHIDTFISLGASMEPTDLGIYLVAAEFTMAGHTSSDLTYFVYATLDEGGLITEDMHDDAIDWVQDNLVNAEAVPEPSSILLGALAGGLGLAVVAVRRRARRAKC